MQLCEEVTLPMSPAEQETGFAVVMLLYGSTKLDTIRRR
jgi:hypothetical protein